MLGYSATHAEHRPAWRLVVFCLASLCLHGALTFLFPARLARHGFPGAGGGPPGSGAPFEVALEPGQAAQPVPPPPPPATSTKTASRPRRARSGDGAVGPRIAVASTQHGRGSGTGKTVSPRPGPRLASADVHRVPGFVRLRPIPAAPMNLRAPGGGSFAPGAFAGGHDGAAGPVAPPEDVLFRQGGRGGAHLPHQAPRPGGGGGNEQGAVSAPDAARSVREPKPGAGSGTGGAEGTAAGGGTGFVNGAGIGTRPDTRSKADVATLQSAPDGSGIGAAPKPATSDGAGTHAPGGGTGTGSPLPGTGGQGTGYGRGNGDDAGNNTNNVPGPAGGGGPGGDGNGPGGRGGVFGVAVPPTGRAPDGRVHVVYLLDCSWSMEEKNKIRKAKAALKQALATLQPGDTFNVVTFAGATSAFASAPQPATRDALRRAARWVDRARMEEGTNLGDALKSAFANSDGRPAAVTQVWVLSDGVPNVGVTDPAALRALARDLAANRTQIVTLALGLGDNFPGAELLQRLAEDSHGTYRLLDLRR